MHKIKSHLNGVKKRFVTFFRSDIGDAKTIMENGVKNEERRLLSGLVSIQLMPARSKSTQASLRNHRYSGAPDLYYAVQAIADALYSIILGLVSVYIYDWLKSRRQKKLPPMQLEIYINHVKDGVVRYKKCLSDAEYILSSNTNLSQNDDLDIIEDYKTVLQILENKDALDDSLEQAVKKIDTVSESELKIKLKEFLPDWTDKTT